MGGGRAILERLRRCVPAPRPQTRATSTQSCPSPVLIPAVVTLAGAPARAARSAGGCSPTPRIPDATVDATAAVCDLAAARSRRLLLLAPTCQKRHLVGHLEHVCIETVNGRERPPGGCQRARASRAVGGDRPGAGYRAAVPLTAMFMVCVGALSYRSRFWCE